MVKEMGEEGSFEHEIHGQHGKDYVDPPPAPLLDMEELRRWSFTELLQSSWPPFSSFMSPWLLLLGIRAKLILVPLLAFLGLWWHDFYPCLLHCWDIWKLSLVRAVAYMVSQCLGAIAGAGLVKAVMKDDYNLSAVVSTQFLLVTQKALLWELRSSALSSLSTPSSPPRP
ncbi:hypothetical protein GH714_016343 [Hevea brasiliensis]|uniref:Uncharacterized protein n=1 Tax=Hevea brasiliensis TaxID=3981 RepID=A0A6A6M1A8_HEVBR|nr:hypothetical protein GH714_016343 [Hevea brasiliensis]